FLVGTLDSLGHLKGEVKTDSGAVVLVVATDVKTKEQHLSAKITGSGAFTVSVPTGTRYRVGAFVDVDGDGKRGDAEPWVEAPEEIRLDLSPESDKITLDVRTKREEKKP